jgi:hypothetical protein
LAMMPEWLGNPSAYAGGNPASLIDPTGLYPVEGGEPSYNCQHAYPQCVAYGEDPYDPGEPIDLGQVVDSVADIVGDTFDRYVGWNPGSVNWWLTQAQLLDLVPVAEVCTAAVLASTGGLGAPAIAACGGLEFAVGVVAAAAFVAQGVMAGCDAHQMAAIGFTAGVSLGADAAQFTGGELFEVGLYVLGTETLQTCGGSGSSLLNESGK